ncbi:hypothetical protein [Neobacillus drentensis]|uniref:hypothetical protein n=1 Tax=Neobacillus drentensis TaxID=220684 RepID=UPI002FFF42D5
MQVINGRVNVGDIVTIVEYGDEERYQYMITGFQKYEGRPQVTYVRVIPNTSDVFGQAVGSWMDEVKARQQLKIIKKKESKSFLSKLFGRR